MSFQCITAFYYCRDLLVLSSMCPIASVSSTECKSRSLLDSSSKEVISVDGLLEEEPDSSHATGDQKGSSPVRPIVMPDLRDLSQYRVSNTPTVVDPSQCRVSNMLTVVDMSLCRAINTLTVVDLSLCRVSNMPTVVDLSLCRVSNTLTVVDLSQCR